MCIGGELHTKLVALRHGAKTHQEAVGIKEQRSPLHLHFRDMQKVTLRLPRRLCFLPGQELNKSNCLTKEMGRYCGAQGVCRGPSSRKRKQKTDGKSPGGQWQITVCLKGLASSIENMWPTGMKRLGPARRHSAQFLPLLSHIWRSLKGSL